MYSPINTRLCTVKMMSVSVVMLSIWGSSSIASVEAIADAPTTVSGLVQTVVNGSTTNTATVNSSAKSLPQSDDEPTLDLSALTMTVYKSPTCGCCSGWVDYMKEEGFTVNSVDTDDMSSIKTQLGLTAPQLKSCHTAVIDGYVIEGHVPGNDVKRLLSERVDILGLTAPGMPMMSPGMASRIPKDYDVLAVDKDGGTQLWSAY